MNTGTPKAALAPVFYNGPSKNGHHFSTADDKSHFIYPTLALAMEAFHKHGRVVQ